MQNSKKSHLHFRMQPTRILVVGGYGFFGQRLVERLSLLPDLHITIAGRSGSSGEGLARKLRPTALSELEHFCVNAMDPAFSNVLKQLNIAVVVNTAGPFQGQNYRVAKSCIAAGAHYIDLADGREFVNSIAVLNSAALRSGVLVTSGASSVPALSSAAADHLARDMKTVRAIDIGISPGNRTERGLSTVQAILSYCGKELPSPGGHPLTGWSGSYRHVYPSPVGSRLHSPCDVPDLVLLPFRYAGTPIVRFGAGLELELLHRAMNLMACMARCGVVKNWAVLAPWLKRAADLFKNWGTDAGAMYVSVTGMNIEGKSITRRWELVATQGDGPYVPTFAATALIRKIASGQGAWSGAVPCVGLLSLRDFDQEMQGLRITTFETSS